jgi:hypothetical protein
MSQFLAPNFYLFILVSHIIHHQLLTAGSTHPFVIIVAARLSLPCSAPSFAQDTWLAILVKYLSTKV